jgi:hypothetical protein
MVKEPNTSIRTWAILRGSPAVEIGWVDALDGETAIKIAIERYRIHDREQQKRLVARLVQ